MNDNINDVVLTEITSDDKNALASSTAIIRCRIIVKATNTLPEIILTDDDSIKDWDYNDDRNVPDKGVIGQFVARTLEGNLQNISEDFNIENREIELQLGVLNIGKKITVLTTESGVTLITEDGSEISVSDITESTTNWYSLGTFIVTDPEDDEVTDNTQFEAMDYTKYFNTDFNADYTDDEFPKSFNQLLEEGQSVTAYWLAKYTCKQCNVKLGQNSFTNFDFTISKNPFKALESCRDVMKAIGKLAFSWVRIDWDDKCYIDFRETIINENNIIDNDQYYSLSTKKELYGPINKVVVGMENIDGESVIVAIDEESITTYGEKTLYVYDNPLTDTMELRQILADNGSANKLLGMYYTPVSSDTVGHIWLKGNEEISFQNMEGNTITTYALNRTISYNGVIATTLDSMGDSEVDDTYAYKNEVLKNLTYTRYDVDKANGRIDEIVISGESTAKDIESIKSSMEDISEDIDDVTKNLDTTNTNLNDVTSRVTATETTITAQGSTLLAYSEQVDDNTILINALKEKTDSQSKTISILSKTINDNGEVTEVTTTNGYTFNSEGLNMYTSENSFNSQLNTEHVQFKNGSSIIVEVSKDGSILTNIHEQGQHQYGYNELYNTYDFVDEYVDIDGEMAYCTFYNGEE